MGFTKCYTARENKAFLQEKQIKSMTWLTNSPDLKPKSTLISITTTIMLLHEISQQLLPSQSILISRSCAEKTFSSRGFLIK